MSTSTQATHDRSTRQPSDVLDGWASPTSHRRVIGVSVGPGGGAVLTTTLRPRFASASATDLAARRAFNLAAKPQAATRIVRAVPEGAMLTRIGGSLNGYAKVVFEGCRGYAPWQSLIRPDNAACSDRRFGSTAIMTAEVKLRALPNMASDILGVIPEGERIRHDGELVNGFLEVDFHGSWGWVWIDSLT